MQADAYPKKTIEVNRQLARAGIRGARLVKGPGYFCFEGPPTKDWIDHTVEVTFLGELTCNQWLETFRCMNANPTNSKRVRVAHR